VLYLLLREQLTELGLGAGARLPNAFLPARSDGGGVVLALADVQAEEDIEAVVAAHVQARPSGLRSALSRHRGAASS
jgi:hypothetical protein